MHILVLQHDSNAHLGKFRTFLEEDGHSWFAVHLNKGEAIPPLAGFDALWVMGGAMNVWETQKYPWLVEEKRFIKHAVEEIGLPYMGICLGHQLLADALGGSVVMSDTPEVGISDVSLTEDGASGILLDGISEVFDCVQWHGAMIKQMPAGAKCLATSPHCPVQAMRWGTRAFSLQFHAEVEHDIISSWTQIPAFSEELDRAHGSGSLDDLLSRCNHMMSFFNATAERIYINWLQATART